MSRSQRLLDLLQILRRHRYPVAGATLASELGISLRSLYRDIATLQQQGATIDGEAGLGYVLRAGYVMPPLMFGADEIEALVLGSRWVAERGDPRLAASARDALAKIASVLPDELRHLLDSSALLVGPQCQTDSADGVDLALLRKAIRSEHTLDIDYRDAGGAVSTRTVWPFALGYFERIRVLVAWCEKRDDFRHFRTDRLIRATVSGQRYPQRRQALLKRWREQEGIAAVD